jgi:hypothetical protein
MGQHEAPNVDGAAAALTEAEAMHASDLQLPWWSRLRWRQTSKEEAAQSERSILSRLVRWGDATAQSHAARFQQRSAPPHAYDGSLAGLV